MKTPVVDGVGVAAAKHGSIPAFTQTNTLAHLGEGLSGTNPREGAQRLRG